MKNKLICNISSVFLVLIFSFAAFAQTESLKGVWILSGLKQNGNSIHIADAKGRGDKRLGVDFTDAERFGLISTCNAMGGQYAVDAAGNFKASAIFGTRMFCGEEAMEIENALAGAMEAVTKYRFGNDALILQDSSGANLLKLTRGENVDRTGDAPPNDKELTLYVASKMARCMGVAPLKCLQVKQKGDVQWTLLYEKIKAFDFKKGNYYVLNVRRVKIDDLPRDAASFRYELIRVVKKTKQFTAS